MKTSNKDFFIDGKYVQIDLLSKKHDPWSSDRFRSKACLKEYLSTKNLILEGARWRIGNGASVKISGDNWIPDNVRFKVHNGVWWLNKEAPISNLIDHDFLHCDILHGEKEGNYSIKFAYHLLASKSAFNTVGPFIPPPKNLWKMMWKAMVYIRVNNFL